VYKRQGGTRSAWPGSSPASSGWWRTGWVSPTSRSPRRETSPRRSPPSS